MTRIVLAVEDDPVRTLRDLVPDRDVIVAVVTTGDRLAMAVARAAVEAVAVERAPGIRVNAVEAGPAATLATVDAAVAYLKAARSVTGQWLAVG